MSDVRLPRSRWWGGTHTDFGEKQNSLRLELMARIYF